MARQRIPSRIQRVQQAGQAKSKGQQAIKIGRPQQDSWHWIYSVMIVGLFFGVLSLVVAGKDTFVTIKLLSQLVAGTCVIGLLVPLPWYAHRIGITRTEGFLFNVLGIGPILCGLLLWSNYFIRSDVREEHHVVISHQYSQESFAGRSVVLTLQDSAYNEWIEMRRFEFNPEEPDILAVDSLILTIGTGILGYDVLIDRVAIATKPFGE